MKAHVLLYGLVAAGVAGAAYATATVTIDQRGLQFSARSVTLQRGSIIRFTNDDRTVHNILVTGEGESLDGGLQQPGRSLSIPFAKAGAYQVTCGIHPRMKLSVVVQ